MNIAKVGDYLTSVDLGFKFPYTVISKIISNTSVDSLRFCRAEACFIRIDNGKMAFKTSSFFCYSGGSRVCKPSLQNEIFWIEACISAGKLVRKPWCFADFLKFKDR